MRTAELWSKEETDSIAAYLASGGKTHIEPSSELVALLPNRSFESIRSKVRRMGKIASKAPKPTSKGVPPPSATSHIGFCGQGPQRSRMAATTPPKPIPTFGRAIASGDWHIPYHNERDIYSMLDFAIDYQPAAMFFVGDIFDLLQLSSFDAMNKVKLAGLPTVDDDLAVGRRILTDFRAALPSTAFIFFYGNHEYRIIRAMESDSQAREYDLGVHLDGIVDLIIPYRDGTYPNIYPFGKLWLAHGEYCNEFHAKKNIIAYNRPVMTFHLHTVQSYTMPGATDVADYRIGWSCPCMCHTNPHYARNRPNAWVNGFMYTDVLPSGDFAGPHYAIINDGRFEANGKWYGG